MNKQEFYQYILDNFNIDGATSRLIDNILVYVEENFTEAHMQHYILEKLLGGPIGLSEQEIENVYM